MIKNQDTTNDLSSLVNFFETLSSTSRRKIIQRCSEQNLTDEQISKLINNNLSSTRKDIASLQKLNLIEKNDKGEFLTTPVGDCCTQSINSFEFLNKHRNFFSEHSFGDLTPKLLKKIGNLKNCEFYYGFHLILPKWSKIITDAKENLNFIFLNPPIVIADFIKTKDASMKIRLMIGKNSVIRECNEFVTKLELHKPAPYSYFEKRRCEQVQTNIIMSEKEACVIFPYSDGTTDMHGNFISKDPDFVSWCHDFFEYKWSDSEAIARIR